MFVWVVLQLATALAESEKNARYSVSNECACVTPPACLCSLLAEYHELYELQRKRLEEQVGKPPSLPHTFTPSPPSHPHTGSLTLEKEVWQQAAYGLAYRVSDAYSLQTIHRLQLGERAWSKLAGHFAVLLSDRDTQQVSDPHFHVLMCHVTWMCCHVTWLCCHVTCSFQRCRGMCKRGGRK